MSIKVFITSDFDSMSRVASDTVKDRIKSLLRTKNEVVLGLATGNSPTGLYKSLASSANNGEFDSGKIRSFNLDEYIGLPGENAQRRVMHQESYCHFMIREFFSLLKKQFIDAEVPYATLIDQKQLENELKDNPDDWKYEGTDEGKSIVIRSDAKSKYLKWIKDDILEIYANKITKCGGIDIQIIGVGGKGHVAFHEAGIPFENSNVLLVQLDDNTIDNAIHDGHFSSREDSPHYGVSMGAKLVFEAKTVIMLASGRRKIEVIRRSLFDKPDPMLPITYGQIYSKNGGEIIYVLDRIAGSGLFELKNELNDKGIEIFEK
jgi:glucosamine-6-phosphate deaminase